MITNKIDKAINALKQGQLIAYPTEAVYGLGCDPMQHDAVERLIKAKQRNPDKGLILIASKFSQLSPFLVDIDQALVNRAKKTWPGPVTWVWPIKRNTGISALVSGIHQSVAIRVSNHPLVVKLCTEFKGAIVSTSANLEGDDPAKTAQQVERVFDKQVQVIIDGQLGELSQPTKIFDVLTEKEIR